MTEKDKLKSLTFKLLPLFTSGFVLDMAKSKATETINNMTEDMCKYVTNIIRAELK